MQPALPDDNPFLHDRKKTFQPRDLWDFLLKLAICLFPLDVGVRRIQLDREEWLKATATLRRWIFFWKGKPRPIEADESLSALLARRDQVRSTQTAPSVQPVPELFQPTRPADLSVPAASGKTESATGREEPAEQESKSADAPAGTTSRLLEAKRRAQRRKE